MTMRQFNQNLFTEAKAFVAESLFSADKVLMELPADFWQTVSAKYFPQHDNTVVYFQVDNQTFQAQLEKRLFYPEMAGKKKVLEVDNATFCQLFDTAATDRNGFRTFTPNQAAIQRALETGFIREQPNDKQPRLIAVLSEDGKQQLAAAQKADLTRPQGVAENIEEMPF